MLIGLAMSGVTLAFILPIHWVEERFHHVDAVAMWWLVVLLPAGGGLAAGLVTRLVRSPSEAPGSAWTRSSGRSTGDDPRCPW